MSVVAMADVTPPSAETSAPERGPPRSSLTKPWMLPRVRRDCCRTGVNTDGRAPIVWADIDVPVNPTIAAAARSPVRRAMDSLPDERPTG
jgi:hypothetical protein